MDIKDDTAKVLKLRFLLYQNIVIKGYMYLEWMTLDQKGQYFIGPTVFRNLVVIEPQRKL